MSNLAYERLHANLVKLKLHTVGTILDNYLEIAAKEGKTTMGSSRLFDRSGKTCQGCLITGNKNETCWFSCKKETGRFQF